MKGKGEWPTIAARISPKLLIALQKKAAEEKTDVSEVVRDACYDYLSFNEPANVANKPNDTDSSEKNTRGGRFVW